MAKTILVPILLIALTDVALQLDNALAISSVAGLALLVIGGQLILTWIRH